MSYQIGMDTINLKKTERLAHTEYCHDGDLKDAVTSMVVKPGDVLSGEEQIRSFRNRWMLDFTWGGSDGPINWEERGRYTIHSHAELLKANPDRRDSEPCPFTDPEQVLEFDAVKEYGPWPTIEELTAFYEKIYQDAQKDQPEQVYPGGNYKTIVSGACLSFGWDMLLLAAADQDRFEKVLDSFFRRTLMHVKAWAKTSIKVYISHDDMVWSEGPFMHPDFYRKVIFPRYAELWKVLKKAGKKVLFCSDGKWIDFLDDIVRAGADGFIFEPMNPLEPFVEKYGQTHVIVGSKVDCRTMTFGTKEQIKAEIDATLPLALKCPGFIFAVGNHIESNVPVENGLFYFDYLSKHWQR